MADEIVVVGSMNMDLVIETDKSPKKGETLIGNDFHQIPGGKGANQALAAGKLGANVTFIGACGKDNYGEQLLNNLKSEGINTQNVHRVKENTGIASITVEKNGDNRIIVIPGANHSLKPELIAEHKKIIKNANTIVLDIIFIYIISYNSIRRGIKVKI